MTEERALVRAVIAAPDDDLPRLVYADWLQENGRAREAEHLRWFLANPDYYQSVAVDHLMPDMTPKLRSRYHTSGEVCGVWHRGFAVEVRATPALLSAYGPRLLADQPVTRVRVVGVEPYTSPLFAGGDGRWGWFSAHAPNVNATDTSTLPDWLFAAALPLARGEPGVVTAPRAAYHCAAAPVLEGVLYVALPTAARCRDLLDRAATAWLRAAADALAVAAGEEPIYGAV